jgi:hypothetical protein
MNRSCVGYRRSRPRHHDTVRLGRDGHRQQLVLRLLANTEGSLAILVSPLEHLVRIYSMLTGHSGNRSSRDKRRFYDATLLLPCPPQPLEGRGRCLNCNCIAHKAIVGQKKPAVYTAKSGRLQSFPHEKISHAYACLIRESLDAAMRAQRTAPLSGIPVTKLRFSGQTGLVPWENRVS